MRRPDVGRMTLTEQTLPIPADGRSPVRIASTARAVPGARGPLRRCAAGPQRTLRDAAPASERAAGRPARRSSARGAAPQPSRPPRRIPITASGDGTRPAAPAHLKIAADRILAAEAVGDALTRWEVFTRPSDHFAAWGGYTLDLLRAKRIALRPLVDLRDAGPVASWHGSGLSGVVTVKH